MSNALNTAIKHGWYDQETKDSFDFAETYGSSEAIDEYGYGTEMDVVNNRRRWRMLSLFSNKELPENELIYEVVPEKNFL